MNPPTYVHEEPTICDMSDNHAEIVARNRVSWNAAVPAHNSHRKGAAAFLRAGGSTLFPEESSLLGHVRGLRIAHLLCGAGHDSISLASLGAIVNGVDVSDEAIDSALSLADDCRSSAKFQRSDVFEWLNKAGEVEAYDIVFASYGVICWLDDISRFMHAVGRILRPNGLFVLVDFHPVAMMYDRCLKREYPYSTSGNPILVDKGVGDYVAKSGDALVPWGYQPGTTDFANPHPCLAFRWGFMDLLTAVQGAGLHVRDNDFAEYGYSNGFRMFDCLEFDKPHRRWRLPISLPSMPMMFSIRAKRSP